MDPLWSVLMFLGSSFCHQLPERSYMIGDLQMPLCARCIGIHLGFVLSSLFLWTGSRRFASAILAKKTYIILAALFFVGSIDAILSYSGLNESDNLRRTVSGLLIGTTIPLVTVLLINKILFPGRNSRILFEGHVDWIWFAAIYLVGAAMILLATASLPLFYVVSVLGVIGLTIFAFTIIMVLVLILTDGKEMRIGKKIAISAVTTAALVLTLSAVHIILFPPTWIG